MKRQCTMIMLSMLMSMIGIEAFAHDIEVANADGQTIYYVSFADANVKALCVANWDTNNDGEISVAEAAAVTSLGEVFKGNTEITSFDELQSFTGVTGIGSDAFNGCTGLTGIVLPNSVTNIGSDAFSGCSSLTSIVIPESVTTIGEDAFWQTGLSSITIPNNVISIGKRIIAHSRVSSIIVEEGNAKYDSRENCNAIIETETNTLIVGCSNTFIPNTVTTIGESAFERCTGLVNMDIPSAVTSIGKSAFYNCTSLTGVTIPNTITSIGDNMFLGCYKLASVNIPNSVTSIGNYAFENCYGLTSISIPSSVTRIGDYAFKGCSGLTSFSVQCETPIAISDNTFLYGCNSNATLYVPTGSKAAYQAAVCWQDFKEIVEKEDAFFVDNAVYLNDTLARQGGKMTLSLKMKNTAAIRGFQFDLYLPEGVTVVKSSKGKIQGELSAGRLPDEDEHTLTFSEQPDGAIRFLCSSQYDETFTGNDGEIATLQVNIAEDMAEGDYLVQLKNMKLTETDISKCYETPLVKCKLTIKSYILGDINSDGVVDVSDYTGVANHIHGNTPEGFVVKAGDVDGSGTIDVSDYTGIANIIHTGSIYGSNAARAMSRSLKKANTDISSNNNVIYIEPFTVAPGTQTVVSIKMKNTAAIRGFQFDLYLPEGMTAIKSAKGRIQGALNANRLPEDDEHDLTFSEQQDGAIRFLCSSQYDETFTGNDGEVATLQVAVAENMTANDYPIVLRNIKLTETDISKFYTTEEIETTVTVNSAADERLLLDEAATDAPDNATGADVRVVRTIAAGNWSTICLPFAMTEEQVKTAFGNGVQLGDFTSWSPVKEGGNVVGINVGFTTVTAIEANHPYIIKVEEPVTEFTVDDVNIEADDEPQVKVGTKSSERGYMYGTYTATTVPEENVFLSGNKFYYSVGDSPIKAFRAYFEFKDVLDAYYDVAEARITFSLDGNTLDATLVNSVEVKSEQLKSEIYNLNGQRISKAGKGVYIVNGKKVVIK